MSIPGVLARILGSALQRLGGRVGRWALVVLGLVELGDLVRDAWARVAGPLPPGARHATDEQLLAALRELAAPYPDDREVDDLELELRILDELDRQTRPVDLTVAIRQEN